MSKSYSEDSVLTDLISKYRNIKQWIGLNLYVAMKSGDKEISRLGEKINSEQQILNSTDPYRRIPSFYYRTLEEEVRGRYINQPEIIAAMNRINIRKRVAKNEKRFEKKKRETIKNISTRLRKEYPYSTSNTALKIFYKHHFRRYKYGDSDQDSDTEDVYV
jgi:hypothetical protein